MIMTNTDLTTQTTIRLLSLFRDSGECTSCFQIVKFSFQPPIQYTQF